MASAPVVIPPALIRFNNIYPCLNCNHFDYCNIHYTITILKTYTKTAFGAKKGG